MNYANPSTDMLDHEDESFSGEGSYRGSIDLTVILIVVYVFWFFTTPYRSNRLGFLGPLQFEKILAISLLGLTLIAGRIQNLFNAVSILMFAVCGAMLMAFLTSEYPNFGSAQHWANDYWKKIVFFVIVAIGLRKAQHLDHVIKGIVCVIVFYQLLSWTDFVRGGSYVYQQGMKRMVGLWSERGYGAANQFGIMSALGLPFIYYWYQSVESRFWKYAMFACGILAMLSIVFTGSRGSLVVAIALLCFTFRSTLIHPKVLALFAIAGLLIIPVLPEKIKHRYWDLMVMSSSLDQESLSNADKMAIHSGKDRFAGLQNGFKLAAHRPLFGYGPGTSALAAVTVLGVGKKGQLLQLHNLYGQIAAETGLIGFAIWLAMMGFVFLKLYSLRNTFGIGTIGYSMAGALISGLFVMLAYGMFAHSFYDEKWLLLIACVAALTQFTEDEFAHEQVDLDFDDYDGELYDEYEDQEFVDSDDSDE
jgi:O-antigen ligase